MANLKQNLFARVALVTAFFLYPFISKADTLTLAECHQLAEAHFPVLKQKALYDKAFALQWQKLRANFLPKFSLNGQASYQSEVVELPFTLPNMETLDLPHERWQVALDINQTLYDGGITRAHRAVEEDQLQIDQQQILIEVHQLKRQVNLAYLSILLAKQSEEILLSTLSLLQEKIKNLQAALQGGIVLESEVLKIEAEVLRLKQRITENEKSRKANMTVLSLLTGTEIDEQALQKPTEIIIDTQQMVNRPEIKLLSLQQQKLVSRTKLIKAQNLPKAYAFAQGGYGYPHPYNFFDASVSPFYMIGVRINWNLWDWNKFHQDKETLVIQSEVLETKKDHLKRNIDIALTGQRADIDRLETTIQHDQGIIRLQEKVSHLSSAQLDQGIITSTEYLDAVNAEHQAKLNLQLHQIQLVQAKINYLTEQGTY